MAMTDREKLESLFRKWEIEPDVAGRLDDGEVVLRAKSGGVNGYEGFVCVFAFDDEGNFLDVGVWE